MKAVFCSEDVMKIALGQRFCSSRSETQSELTEFEFIDQIMELSHCDQAQQADIDRCYKTYKVE